MDLLSCSTTNGVVTLDCVGPLIFNILSLLFTFAGIAALFFVILGGFKFLTSGGEKEKVEEARKTITWALIGLVVILLSFAVIRFLGDVTGTKCINAFGVNGCGLPKTTCDDASAPVCKNKATPVCLEGAWSCGEAGAEESSCVGAGGDCTNDATICCGGLACNPVEGAHGISTCR